MASASRQRILAMLDFRSLKNVVKRPLLVGYAGLLLMVVAISAWTMAVPLTESTVASGTVSVSAQRRTVAHVDGGRIEKLFVLEGDLVQPGQALLRLDTQELESELETLRYKHFARAAAIDRLTAERKNTSELTFRPDLLELASRNATMAQFLEGEKRNFYARKESYAAKEALLDEPAVNAKGQRKRLAQQLQSLDRQLNIVRRQAANATELYRKGFGTQSKAVAFEREVEQLITRHLEFEANLAELDGVIDEAERQSVLHGAEFKDALESEVLLAEREIAEFDGRIRAIEKDIENHTVRSSVQGVVVDLRNLSVNDVITAATPMIDIVPTDSTFIVEVHLPPAEIDGIFEGLEAEVRFPAFASNDLSGIKGRVTLVSADVVEDAATTHAYYRIHVAMQDRPDTDGRIEIIPGMPADVLIKKRKRTLLQYILAPLTDHAMRAFAV